MHHLGPAIKQTLARRPVGLQPKGLIRGPSAHRLDPWGKIRDGIENLRQIIAEARAGGHEPQAQPPK
jgi:hypothetical protein